MEEYPDYRLWKKIQNWNRSLWEICSTKHLYCKKRKVQINDLILYFNKLEKRVNETQNKQKIIINKDRCLNQLIKKEKYYKDNKIEGDSLRQAIQLIKHWSDWSAKKKKKYTNISIRMREVRSFQILKVLKAYWDYYTYIFAN